MGGFKSKARKKRASAIIAEKKGISQQNVDQPTKFLSRKGRERALKRIKEKKGISVRRRFMNCEVKKKNEIKTQIARPSISI